MSAVAAPRGPEGGDGSADDGVEVEPTPAVPGDAAPLDVDDATLRRGLEAVLFTADEPLGVEALATTLGLPEDRVGAAVRGLADEVAARDGGVALVAVAGGWRLLTADAARPVLERWIVGSRHGRLTQAALETLAVIAYRQPIARTTIGEIRGVNPDGALRSLVARGLVAEVGRDEGPGQAVLFGTTVQFLERMGLAGLDDLPPLPAYLPGGPAPDEPDASGLADLRRRLREGSERLGAQPQQLPLEDEDDTGGLPAPRRARPADDAAIEDLSERLERAARSAMGRLRSVRDADGTGSEADDDG
ncbi:MAG: SMC-Scp complex subunit ScpB [Nitriliruptoraceae bacterium]